MTLDDLRALAREFFEWPENSDGRTVSTISTLLFAQHVLQLREKSLGAQNSASTPTLRDAAQQALAVINDTAYGAAVYRKEVRDVIAALRAALERQEMDDKEAAAFHAGAKAMFDALLYRIANNWHPASQAECDAQNDWATEWATDALDEVSPESCTKWRSITQAWADGYNLGMGLGTARAIERAHGIREEEK